MIVETLAVDARHRRMWKGHSVAPYRDRAKRRDKMKVEIAAVHWGKVRECQSGIAGIVICVRRGRRSFIQSSRCRRPSLYSQAIRRILFIRRIHMTSSSIAVSGGFFNIQNPRAQLDQGTHNRTLRTKAWLRESIAKTSPCSSINNKRLYGCCGWNR